MAVKRLLPEDCSEEGESATVPPELLYHHIVSNPPWFVDSLPSPHAGRRVARHADSLPYGELLQHAARLLAPEGLFSVVLPADSEERFLAGARVAGFGLNRRTRVFTLPGNISQARLARIRFRRKLRGDARRRHPDNRDRRGPWELYG